jgi:Ca2+-binding RTX toxin-like protein
MAIVRARTTALDMTNLDVTRASQVFGNATTIRLQFGFRDVLLIRGEFTYDSEGNLTGGTVRSLERVTDGDKLYNVTGLSAPAVDFVAGLAEDDLTPLIANTLAGNDVISGSTGQDTLLGFDGDDRLSGGDDSDVLVGGAGRDKLFGGEGGDILRGGAGGDILTGGAGDDVFEFAAVSDSTARNSGRDRIVGFESGDLIDLSLIDAVQTAGSEGTNEEFTLVEAFTGVAGQLIIRTGELAGSFVVEGDVNGDSKADFAILFEKPVDAPTVSDFVF